MVDWPDTHKQTCTYVAWAKRKPSEWHGTYHSALHKFVKHNKLAWPARGTIYGLIHTPLSVAAYDPEILLLISALLHLRLKLSSQILFKVMKDICLSLGPSQVDSSPIMNRAHYR